MHLWVRNLPRKPKQLSVWGTKAELRARVGRPKTSWSPPVISLLAVPRRHFCFVSSKLLFFVFLARLIAVASTVYTCLVCNSSLVATCPSIPAARFVFRLFYSFCFSWSWLLYLVNQDRSKGEGWSTTNWFKPPSNFYCWPSQGGSSALVLWWFWMWRVVICGYSRYI